MPEPAVSKELKALQEFNGLVLRCEKVSFMEVNGKYYRMKGFTDLPTSKEAQEYSRTYVDESSERTSTVGVTSSTEFTLDYYKGNPVHERIQEVFDKEQIGDKATVNIVVVDFSKEARTAGFYAIKRNVAIVPDTEGDGTEAYQYSGTFKANGKAIEGTATAVESDKDWLTITFKDGFEAKTA